MARVQVQQGAGGAVIIFNELKAYSPAALENRQLAEDMERGNRVVLPPAVLNRLTQRRGDLPNPMIFEISRQSAAPGMLRYSHCGVLEFSAADNQVVLPRWLMENLWLEEGEPVRLKLRALPKATYVRFVPQERAFARIADPKRMLEHALVKFVSLTEGDTVALELAGQRYHLRVEEVRPRKPIQRDVPPAVCVVDANVTVEFGAPAEAAAPEAKVDELVAGAEVSGQLQSGAYRYFRVGLSDPSHALELRLESKAGDADMYVSTHSNTPSVDDYEWAAFEAGAVHTLTLQAPAAAAAAAAGRTWFYVAVHAYEGDAAFTLAAREVEKKQEEDAAGNRLGSRSAPHGDDDRQCDNCLAWIPPQTFAVHVSRCARANWRCGECGELLRTAERASHDHCPECRKGMSKDALRKHAALAHRTAPCAQCGEAVAPRQMARHLSAECSDRLVPCSVCALPVPLRGLDEHEGYCSAKSVTCEICGKDVQRARLDIHRAVEHGVNPSLAPGGAPPAAFAPRPQPQPSRAAARAAVGVGAGGGAERAAAPLASPSRGDDLEDPLMQAALEASLSDHNLNALAAAAAAAAPAQKRPARGRGAARARGGRGGKRGSGRGAHKREPWADELEDEAVAARAEASAASSRQLNATRQRKQQPPAPAIAAPATAASAAPALDARPQALWGTESSLSSARREEEEEMQRALAASLEQLSLSASRQLSQSASEEGADDWRHADVSDLEAAAAGDGGGGSDASDDEWGAGPRREVPRPLPRPQQPPPQSQQQPPPQQPPPQSQQQPPPRAMQQRPGPPPWAQEEEEEESGDCPMCGRALPISQLVEHAGHCAGAPESRARAAPAPAPPQPGRLPCVYCGREFPESDIAAHMSACLTFSGMH
jgi:antitoxin component of MazEF toxin-antitoxin module